VKEPIQIKSPETVLPLMQKWRKQKQENFLTITLNGSHEIINIHHISKGLVNKTIIHPRECFYPAIKDLAVAVILIHNHPSGSIRSSPEDDEITKRMSMAAEILGINILDHIIISPRDNYYSYRKDGRMLDNHKVYELENFVESIKKEYAG
jgi:DNA repair protein RadC